MTANRVAFFVRANVRRRSRRDGNSIRLKRRRVLLISVKRVLSHRFKLAFFCVCCLQKLEVVPGPTLIGCQEGSLFVFCFFSPHPFLHADEGGAGALIGQMGPAGPQRRNWERELMHVLRRCTHAALMHSVFVRALAVRSVNAVPPQGFFFSLHLF